MNNQTRRRSLPANRHSQRGVVLIIALIVLVSMTLAAIGMSRSIDTANLVAGNLGFKQSSLNAADQGLRAGFEWLVAKAGSPALNNTDLTQGYSSAASLQDPDWYDSGTWAGAAFLNNKDPDAAGNVISYVIERLCSERDTPYNEVSIATGQPNQCVQSESRDSSATGQSKGIPARVYQAPPLIYYRVTARAQGPRSTESYVQTIISLTN